MSVVKSLTGSPWVSKPQVSARNCSTFCSANTLVSVVRRADKLELVEIMNICAMVKMPVTMISMATITSANDMPASPAHLQSLNFSKGVHRNRLRGASLLHCDRDAVPGERRR